MPPTALPNEPSKRKSALRPMRPMTLVDRVVDAVVRAATEAYFLPGDKLIEADIARSLGVSRVPVREALRVLESQGILVNEPYKGMRLMDVNQEKLREILLVRAALEQLAAREALRAYQNEPESARGIEAVLVAMRRAADDGDRYSVANLDTAFHRTLCEMANNRTLVQAWEPLSRQLTIIFALTSLQKPLHVFVKEHEDLLATLKGGDPKKLERAIEAHVVATNYDVDFEAIVAQYRNVAMS